MLPGLIMGIAVLPLLLSSLWRLQEPPAVRFMDVKQQVTVNDVRLKSFEPPVARGTIVSHFRHHAWVYGTISNDTDYRWENPEFNVKFLNSAGEQIDIDNTSKMITIEAHSKLEIKLDCDLAIDPKEIAETKITVTSAKRPYR